MFTKPQVLCTRYKLRMRRDGAQLPVFPLSDGNITIILLGKPMTMYNPDERTFEYYYETRDQGVN